MLGQWVIARVGRRDANWQQKVIWTHDIFPQVFSNPERSVVTEIESPLCMMHLQKKWSSPILQYIFMKMRWFANSGTAEPESTFCIPERAESPSLKMDGYITHLRECQSKWTGYCNEDTKVRKNDTEIRTKIKIHTWKETTSFQGQNNPPSSSLHRQKFYTPGSRVPTK